jgi:hypothetical protein
MTIWEIKSGQRYCYKTATKGYKGNKRLIVLIKEFVKKFIKTETV